jgi:opacity protein-like surface antigen
MSITILLAACLLTDPSLENPGSVLSASEIGRAALRAFDVGVLGAAGPRIDPLADPAPMVLPKEGDDAAFSYTFAEIGYARTKLSDASDHSNAGYIRASIGFLKWFHIFGGYVREDTNFDNATVDGYELGAGVQFSVLKKLDLVGEASWMFNHIDSDTLFSGDNNNGVSLFGGVRWMVLPDLAGGLEVNGGLRYSDIDSLSSSKAATALELGGRFHFSRLLSLGLTYDYRDSDQTVAIDARFSF